MPVFRPAASAPILVQDRTSGRLFEEKVLGRGALDWTYGTVSGRIFAAAIGRHGWFSALYGRTLHTARSRAKVAPFVKDFGIDLNEAVVPEGGFASFNDFFIRKLKPGARPLAGDERTAVLPADARHLFYENTKQTDGFVVKGHRFDLAELLGDSALGARFNGGSMLISRLCPVDYHRFHFPVSGRATEASLLNGPLYSVSPVALRRNVRYLAMNKRTLTRIESPAFGLVLMLEIGATMVGSIRQTARAGDVRRGDEKGYFEFGGSCTISLFEPGRLLPAPDLAAAGREHREVYARMGTALGTANQHPGMDASQ